VQNGLGRHFTALSASQLENINHWSFVHYLINLAGLALAKISICLLLIKLAKHRRFVYALWALTSTCYPRSVRFTPSLITSVQSSSPLPA